MNFRRISSFEVDVLAKLISQVDAELSQEVRLVNPSIDKLTQLRHTQEWLFRTLGFGCWYEREEVNAAD